MHAFIFYLKIIQPSKKNLQAKSLFIISNVSKIKFLIWLKKTTIIRISNLLI